jgi:hypothetical protein
MYACMCVICMYVCMYLYFIFIFIFMFMLYLSLSTNNLNFIMLIFTIMSENNIESSVKQIIDRRISCRIQWETPYNNGSIITTYELQRRYSADMIIIRSYCMHIYIYIYCHYYYRDFTVRLS